MPSTDRKLELQTNDNDVSTVSQTTAYWNEWRDRSRQRRLSVPMG